jgi:hypothetical protein
VRKLLSIGIALALLVTFIVPVIVAAQDECCEWTPPTARPLPDRTTKTLAGGVVWTLEVALTSFLNMEDLGKSIGDLLRGIAEVLAGDGA